MATAATATLAAAGAALAEPARPQAGAAIETAKGIVFETNARGERGVGLAGVLVSNGREIVRTGLDGGYSLPIEPGMAIFVIKPAGYAAPLEPATRLPRFFYIHQPDGTPAELNLTFSGLAPTGPLPDSIDFGLIRTAEPKRFDVILFTDPQPESEAEVDYIRDDVVNDLIGADAAFGITAGDLMFDDLSLYRRYNQIIAQIGLALVERRRQPRPKFRKPGPALQPRDLQARFRAELLRLRTWRRAVYHARQCRVSRTRLQRPKWQGEICRPHRRKAARLRRQSAGGHPGRDADRAGDAYPARNICRSEQPVAEHRRRRRASRSSRRPAERQFLRPHAYYGASLSLASQRIRGRPGASSSCVDRGLGLVVERSGRQARHCERRQPRRQSERFPYPFDRRDALCDPFRSGERTKWPPDADQPRRPFSSRKGGLSRFPHRAGCSVRPCRRMPSGRPLSSSIFSTAARKRRSNT